MYSSRKEKWSEIFENETELRSFCYDINKVQDLIKEVKKIHSSQTLPDHRTLIKLEAVETQIRNDLYYRKSFEQSEYLNLLKIKSFFIEELRNGNYSVLNGPLFDDRICPLIFSKRDNEIIRLAKDSLIYEAKKIYKALISGKKITKAEENKIYSCLNCNLNSQDSELKEIAIGMFRQIFIDKRIDYLKLQFIMQFVANEKAVNKVNDHVKGYLTCYNEEGKKTKETLGLDDYDKNYFLILLNNLVLGIGNIVFSYEIKDTESFLCNMITTIFHEMEHHYQWNSLFNNSITDEYEALDAYSATKFKILSRGMSKGKFNEYVTNYYYKEIELLADANAYFEAANFIEKYLPEYRHIAEIFRKYSVECTRKLSFGMMYDEKKQIYSLTDYNIEKMQIILMGNPKLLEKYPLLQKIYNNNGVLRSFPEILFYYGRSCVVDKDGTKEFYREALEYLVNHGALKNFNVEEYPEELQLYYFLFIRNDMRNRRMHIINILNSEEEFDKKQKELVSQMLITNMNALRYEYHSYIYNELLISELNEATDHYFSDLDISLFDEGMYIRRLKTETSKSDIEVPEMFNILLETTIPQQPRRAFY